MGVLSRTWKSTTQKLAIPRVMGASVSSGAHSGFIVVWCSKEEEVLLSAGLRAGDVGRSRAADSLRLPGESCLSIVRTLDEELLSSGTEGVLNSGWDVCLLGVRGGGESTLR